MSTEQHNRPDAGRYCFAPVIQQNSTLTTSRTLTILVKSLPRMDLPRPDTTLLDCIVYLMQHFYDPGILPSSAD